MPDYDQPNLVTQLSPLRQDYMFSNRIHNRKVPMRNTIATLLLILVLGTASTAGAEVLNSIVAIVNDEIITSFELNREYALLYRLKNAPKKSELERF